MQYIDKNDIIRDITKDGEFIDRKIICEICSTMKENYYIDKVTMNFNHQNNLYTCPKCGIRISGAYIEKIIYFQNKDFIYEPTEAEDKKEQKLVMGFGGLFENDEVPEPEIVTLDESQSPL